MALLAQKKVITSKGTFLPGESLPNDLPKKERDRLSKTGAVGEPATSSEANEANEKDRALGKSINDAKAKVAEAEQALKDADGEGTRKEAEQALDNARDALLSLVSP